MSEELKLKLFPWKFANTVKGVAVDMQKVMSSILKKTGAKPLKGNPLWEMLSRG